jgi:hypothetical protein
VYLVQRFLKAGADGEKVIRAVIYVMEHAVKATGQVTIVSDRLGTDMSNYGTDIFKLANKLLSILQDNYPESMKRCLILYPNTLYRFIFKVIRPFMSERTAEKMISVEEDSEILKFVARDQLPRNYGGTA